LNNSIKPNTGKLIPFIHSLDEVFEFRTGVFLFFLFLKKSRWHSKKGYLIGKRSGGMALGPGL
jgi:hypothetical protein